MPGAALASDAAAVAALTVLVAGAGFLRLGGRSIWGDEAISISYASGSLGELHAHLDGDPNMSLYYGLLWVWTHVFGQDLTVIRGLSVLFAAVTVPVLYALGRRLLGVRAGLAAAALLSTNAYFLHYAQEARGYSLVVLLVTASTLLFVRALDAPGAARCAAYAVVSALAFYAHFFAGFVVVVHVLVLLALRRRAAFTRPWVLAYAPAAVLVSPLCFQAARVGSNPIGWVDRPGLHELADAARALSGSSYYSLAALLVIAAASFRYGRGPVPGAKLAGAIALPWLLGPLVLAFVLSQLSPMLVTRYLVVSLPAVGLAAALALARLEPRLAAAGFAALLLLAVVPLRAWYERPGDQDWLGAAAFVLSQARPGDGIAYEISAGAPAIAYYAPGRKPPGLTRLPRSLAGPLPGRVWVALWQGDRLPASRLRRRGYALRAGSDFHGDIRIELYSGSR
jgi:uncharacterized membrane protein